MPTLPNSVPLPNGTTIDNPAVIAALSQYFPYDSAAGTFTGLTQAAAELISAEIDSYEARVGAGDADPFARRTEIFDSTRKWVGGKHGHWETQRHDTGRHTTDHLNGLQGFKFPAHMSQTDFLSAVTASEQWAASTGMKYMPTGNDILALYNQYGNVGGLDPTVLGQFFSQRMLSSSDQQRMPWALYGLTQQSWHQRTNSLKDTYESWSGDRNLDQGMLETAMRESWSTDRLRQELLKDPTFTRDHGWVKYGMDYQSFQTHKMQNRQQIIARYGMSAADQDQSYLADLAAPLQSFAAAGGAVKNVNQDPLADIRSAVR